VERIDSIRKGNQSISTSPSDKKTKKKLEAAFRQSRANLEAISGPLSIDMRRVSGANSNIDGVATSLETFRKLSPKAHLARVQHRLAKVFIEEGSVESLWVLQCIGEIFQCQKEEKPEAAEKIANTYLNVFDELKSNSSVCSRGLYHLATDKEFSSPVEGKDLDSLLDRLLKFLAKRFENTNLDSLKNADTQALLKPLQRSVGQNVEGECLKLLKKEAKVYESPLQEETDLEIELCRLADSMARLPARLRDDNVARYQEQKAKQIARFLLQHTRKGQSTIRLIDHLLDFLSKRQQMDGCSAIEDDLYALRYRLTFGELDAGEVSKDVEKMVFPRGLLEKEVEACKKMAETEIALRVEAARLWEQEYVTTVGSFFQQAFSEEDPGQLHGKMVDSIDTCVTGASQMISFLVEEVMRKECQSLFDSENRWTTSCRSLDSQFHLYVKPSLGLRTATTTLRYRLEVEEEAIATIDLRVELHFDANTRLEDLLIRPWSLQFTASRSRLQDRLCILDVLHQLDNRPPKKDDWYLDL
jgi:hypothetical protein